MIFVFTVVVGSALAAPIGGDLGTCSAPKNYKACMVKCGTYDSCITCCGHFDSPWYEKCKGRCQDRWHPCEIDATDSDPPVVEPTFRP